MEQNKYRLKYILVGASGSGKTTMAKILQEKLGFCRCITYTTRPMRPGEINGVDYHFRPKLDPKEMFEHSFFGGNAYGITWDELARGDFIILEPQGVQYYREHFPAKLIVIQLQRENIQVDETRKNRDVAADFDAIAPDFIVSGETIDAMATNLLNVISQAENERNKSCVDKLIRAAEEKGRTTKMISPSETGRETVHETLSR